MIGYYVHHHGRGHLRRACAIAARLGVPITGISSLARPEGWPGQWLQLERDDVSGHGRSETADGRLHWAPKHDAGLRHRMAKIAAWIDRTAPEAMVVDVSVEVALFARLHGVPVVSIALPGVRSDHAHRLGFDVSDAIIGAWPEWAMGMLRVDTADTPGAGPVAQPLAGKLFAVGAISVQANSPGRTPASIHRVVVLGGGGGGGMREPEIRAARAQTPGVEWIEVGTSADNWSPNPADWLRRASMVVSHAGQGAVADIAAVGVPALVVPQERPFREQIMTAHTLSRADGLPVMVANSFARNDWAHLLERAGQLDGRNWKSWNDGYGADRAAAVIRDIAGKS